MTIDSNNDSRRLPLQRELPGWTLDERTVTWLWMVLRDMDRQQRLGLRLDDREFGARAMFDEMADVIHRLQLADKLFDEKQMYVLPAHDLQWIEKSGRQVNWLLHELTQNSDTPRLKWPSRLNHKDAVIAVIDFWPDPIADKKKRTERLRRGWLQHLEEDKYFAWLKKDNEKQKCEVAWDWYQDNHHRHLRETSRFAKPDNILFFLDTSGFTLDEKRFHIEEIKKELKRRQARSNLEGKKQTNFALPEEVRRQLDELVEQYGLTKKQIIERLIRHAAANGLPDGNADNRPAP
jgi:hypothetical protein